MLWQQIEQTRQTALQTGALQPTATCLQRVWDEGVNFLVRVVEHPRTKRWPDVTGPDATGPDGPEVGRGRAGGANPFLPYERALFVADASPSHVCLLNKFPVVDRHLLIVTRDFQPQASPLDESDFEALWNCMRQFPSLGFYNGGQVAGASQPHRHLQLVPLPLADEGPAVPIEPLLVPPPRDTTTGGLQVSLPFPHAFLRLDDASDGITPAMPRRMLQAYRRLLADRGLHAGPDRDLPAYNLLVTRLWMLLVPRTVECWETISVNALGFAGALLVRNTDELDRLKTLRPMPILRHVTSASAV